MTKSKNELTYLRNAVQNATAVGLVVILYDILIADLKGAIAAIAQNNIDERSKQIKHAFLVIEQLEQSLDRENGGEAATNLSRFYSALRSNIMSAHVKVSSELLEHQIRLIFQVRGAWVQVDKPNVDDSVVASMSAGNQFESPAERQLAGAGWTA